MEKRKHRKSKKTSFSPRPSGSGKEKRDSGGIWLYGRHAVEAALGNSARKIHQILITRPVESYEFRATGPLPQIRQTSPRELEELLPPDAPHQGIAAKVAPLAAGSLEELLEKLQEKEKSLLVILDQITDPQNVGAIMRSAAAFGADAVITTERNSAPESGALAKAASGALELLPYIRVVNLARALEKIGDSGYWRIGLDGNTSTAINQIKPAPRIALVMGAEGTGLRRLTAENCDEIARLPINPAVESLNVSNAAAISLYHFSLVE